MNRAVLTERLRAHDRLWCRIGITLGPALLLLALAGPPLLSRVVGRRFEKPPEGPEKWLAVIPPLVLAAGFGLLLALVIWCGRWTARRFGLVCPSCGVSL